MRNSGRLLRSRVCLRFDAIHSKPSDRVTIFARLQARRRSAVDLEFTLMGMATEYMDRSVRFLAHALNLIDQKSHGTIVVLVVWFQFNGIVTKENK